MCSLTLLEELTEVSSYSFTAVQNKVSTTLRCLFCQVHSAAICVKQLMRQDAARSVLARLGRI